MLAFRCERVMKDALSRFLLVAGSYVPNGDVYTKNMKVFARSYVNGTLERAWCGKGHKFVDGIVCPLGRELRMNMRRVRPCIDEDFCDFPGGFQAVSHDVFLGIVKEYVDVMRTSEEYNKAVKDQYTVECIEGPVIDIEMVKTRCEKEKMQFYKDAINYVLGITKDTVHTKSEVIRFLADQRDAVLDEKKPEGLSEETKLRLATLLKGVTKVLKEINGYEEE